MSHIKSVLFVCTGNSCRSVMAEAILKKMLEDSAKNGIKVSSAGTGALNGMPPTKETIEVLKERGIKVQSSGSRSLSAAMIREADLILVMEDIHKEQVLKYSRDAAAKTFFLKEYKSEITDSPEDGMGIPDPIGRSIELYRHVMDMIMKELERIERLL